MRNVACPTVKASLFIHLVAFRYMRKRIYVSLSLRVLFEKNFSQSVCFKELFGILRRSKLDEVGKHDSVVCP